MRAIKDLINAEFNYYLSKFVLEYLIHENALSQEEAISICDILKEKYAPPSFMLEEIYGKRDKRDKKR